MEEKLKQEPGHSRAKNVWWGIGLILGGFLTISINAALGMASAIIDNSGIGTTTDGVRVFVLIVFTLIFWISGVVMLVKK